MSRPASGVLICGHIYRPYHANGLCRTCYNLNWREAHKTPERRAEAVQNTRRYRQANPEKARQSSYRTHLKKVYGLSAEDYTKLLAGQDGKCTVCGNVPKSPTVDHCHKTGKVRAVLCRQCNAGLGNFGESIVALAGAIAYLKAHSEF